MQHVISLSHMSFRCHILVDRGQGIRSPFIRIGAIDNTIQCTAHTCTSCPAGKMKTDNMYIKTVHGRHETVSSPVV